MNKIIHFDEITSTNDYLKDNYNKLPNYTICYADYQTKGRGRINRKWQANKGDNITMSVLINDKQLIESVSFIPCITLQIAVSVHKVLSQYVSNLKIKWPNDLLVDGKKLCGILTEGISTSNCIEAIISGIGINVNQENFVEELINNTTSVCIETNKKFEIKDLIVELSKKITDDLNSFFLNNYSSIDYLKEHLFGINEMVSFYRNNEIETGTIIDVNNDGSLKLNVNGKNIDVESGEIKIIR